MKSFSYQDRLQNIEQMKSKKFDLVVIGGGINGAGVARDAVGRGLSVALVEAHDFASGTSSRSSKLIHGGIRYLENLDFHLVFEALNERTKLFEIAPHLVHPLRFMLPLYKSSRVGMLKMGLGMWLYDALSLFQAPELHERLSSRESLERMPSLQDKDLLGSYVYSDAYMDDDRLVHETLRSANEGGAVCASYVKAVGADFQGERISAVVCQDQISGEKFKIQAQHVVSSVGPWTDQLGSSLFQDWQKILRPTKGIHLTLPKQRLPLESAVVMAAEKNNRIIFGIPRHDMIILGTTDTDFNESPENVQVTPEDVRYLLKITEHYFPGTQLGVPDIIASYAGVRPLVNDGSSSEGKVSREHTIIDDPRGVTFVAGGKYTTYRLMAEEVVQVALHHFDLSQRGRLTRSATAEPLNIFCGVEACLQAKVLAPVWARETGRAIDEVNLLVERYGMEAESILKNYPKTYTYWQLEAAQAIDHTMCFHLTDFYIRRVPLFLGDRNHGVQLLNEVGEVFQEKLHWDEAQLKEELHQLTEYMARELQWKKHI